MSSTILYRGYTVTSSLGERNIFLKLVDQVSFANYEATLEQKDFRLQHDLPTIYKVMMDTFAEKDDNFKLDISILSGFMKLNFHALFGGFLNIQFEVVLREKVVATEVLQSSKIEQALRQLENKVREKDEKIIQLMALLKTFEERDREKDAEIIESKALLKKFEERDREKDAEMSRLLEICPQKISTKLRFPHPSTIQDASKLRHYGSSYLKLKMDLWFPSLYEQVYMVINGKGDGFRELNAALFQKSRPPPLHVGVEEGFHDFGYKMLVVNETHFFPIKRMAKVHSEYIVHLMDEKEESTYIISANIPIKTILSEF
jgi:hypothetical protein